MTPALFCSTTCEPPLLVTVLQLLSSTGLFPNTEAELSIWLRHLSTVDGPHQESVVIFFESIVGTVIHDPYTYAECISELVVQAGSLSTKCFGAKSKQETDNDSATTGSAMIDSRCTAAGSSYV